MLPVPARRAGVIVPSPTTLDTTPAAAPEGFEEREPAMRPPTKSFGSVLRETRRARGYSLRAFAATVGVSPAYVSVIEQGKVGPPAVAHLREDGLRAP
ncbi:MAG: helix-turn-helix transcriptional regulator [Phycisphaeraceae bacterium]|nr:helix-turn-helix transcriptional regulator [Phycisphaeraceae bacterium]